MESDGYEKRLRVTLFKSWYDRDDTYTPSQDEKRTPPLHRSDVVLALAFCASNAHKTNNNITLPTQ